MEAWIDIDDTAAGLMRSKAYQSFTRHLLARDIQPGQFLSQRELVTLTGLPLGVIRELIPRLEAEGLIKTVPQRGLQITHLDLDLVREVFQFRLFIEREAIALFCQSASQAQLDALRAQHEAMLERVNQEGESPSLEAQAKTVDCNLHNTIVAALDNKIIWRAYNTNAIKMWLINQKLVRMRGRIAHTMQEHLGIISAIGSRQPQKAVDAITAHINKSRAIALKI